MRLGGSVGVEREMLFLLGEASAALMGAGLGKGGAVSCSLAAPVAGADVLAVANYQLPKAAPSLPCALHSGYRLAPSAPEEAAGAV